MNVGTTKSIPRVETLLSTMYDDFAQLQAMQRVLHSRGLASDNILQASTLMAFAFLGDHDRHKVLSESLDEWDAILAKGFAKGEPANVSTPMLRLLLAVLPHIHFLQDVEEWLSMSAMASPPPAGLLRCVAQAQGRWGDFVNISFQAIDCDCVLISYAGIFGRQPALLHADQGRLSGHFKMPVDDGEVSIVLLQKSSGKIFRHVIQVTAMEFE